MSPEMLVVIMVSVIGLIILGLLIYRKLPRRLNQKAYIRRWRELQAMCKDKSTWREAIISADNLLDRALRQRKFKGSTPGERLVSAQRKFTKNDEVWDSHKLFKKIISNEEFQPKEEQTKKSLTVFRQALRDLGALPDDKK